jgi:hypothetical protein
MELHEHSVRINNLFLKHREFGELIGGRVALWYSQLISSLITATNGEEIIYFTASCKENDKSDGNVIRVLAITDAVAAFTELEIPKDPYQNEISTFPVRVIATNKLEEYSVANQLGINPEFSSNDWPGLVTIKLTYPKHIFELPFSSTNHYFNVSQQKALLQKLPKDLYS